MSVKVLFYSCTRKGIRNNGEMNEGKRTSQFFMHKKIIHTLFFLEGTYFQKSFVKIIYRNEIFCNSLCSEFFTFVLTLSAVFYYLALVLALCEKCVLSYGNAIGYVFEMK